MLIMKMLIAVISIVICIGASCANQQPTVGTPLGKISGHHKSSFGGLTYSAFEGIPYARPPVGHLRFEQPQLPGPWRGLLQATTLHTCLQFGTDSASVYGQEDCLYLNVYVPKEQPSHRDNFDVLVYIHGGAFMVGNPTAGGPAFFMDRNIIYVHLSYRLGLLGFLSTEDNVVPGNNGLKDQQLALKWIQCNIKRFGGNPNSVTLIGESAGGASVHFHYFSPLSKGLFHRGISFSGTALLPWVLQEAALERTKKLSVLADCYDSQIRNIINCLKKVPGNDLVGKTSHFYGISNIPIAPFAPVIEKTSTTPFLTENPYQLLLRGEINDLPWITSVSMDEGLFIENLADSRLDEIKQNWNTLLPILLDYNYTVSESNKVDVADKIRKHYFDSKELSSNDVDDLIRLFGDRSFKVGFEIAAHLQTNVSKSPIYAYVYNYKTDLGHGYTPRGVPHAADALLLFDLPGGGRTASSSDVSIKDTLYDIITSFIKDGNPQVKGITWDPLRNEKYRYLHIENMDKIAMLESYELTPWKFWKSLPIMEYN